MSKQDNFVHLHNHSHYSMLDGHSLVPQMVGEAARLGQPAIAVSDHGNMHAAYELQKEGAKQGVQPIFGLEAYMAPTSLTRFDHKPAYYGRRGSDGKPEGGNDVSGRGSYTHLTMLARSNEGLKNLFHFNKKSYTEGYYMKPRGDLDLLAEHSNGLILTTGCPSGEIQTRLNLGQEKEALEYAAKLQDIVGRENFFLELMDHEMSIDLERKVLPKLLELGKKLNIPLLATNDAHYARKEDAIAQERMLAMQTGASMDDPTMDEGGKRFAFSGEGYYIKSYDEMARLFPESDFNGALSNTLLVAEMTKGVAMEFDPNLRPMVEVPEGYTLEEWFRKETFEGAKRRWGAVLEAKYVERLEYEISVIIDKGFVDYFLVTADFIQWAKDNGIAVGPGRGSAGGSAIAYSLFITEVDPIRHGLIFERFLNPGRDSPPDMDIDFDEVARARVIAYVTEKYGIDKVANIATFTKIGVKMGIRDAGSILRQPMDVVNALSKALPEAQAGTEITFDGIYNPESKRYGEAHDFREEVARLGAQDIIEVARSVEGRNRGTGVHAAGLIISQSPIEDRIPVMARNRDGLIITQFDYPTCESLGFIKFDFLGLRTLTILANTVVNIKRSTGKDIDMMDILHGTLDDKKTFDLLRNGETVGVFQFEGGGMRDLLRRMKPTHFGDIEACQALFRPGPMGMNSHNEYADRKNGLQPVKYPHPEFDEVLEPTLGHTYGLIVYQEQVMEIATLVAGYTLGEADELRRAMGKKKKEILDAEYLHFYDGAQKNGYSDAAIEALWETLVPFSEYGFNKSHAAAYGLISFIAAYFKAHFPAEYMAANLNSNQDDKDKVALYLHEAAKMGISVQTPDINKAAVKITSSDSNTIIFGLGAIRGFSADKSEAIVVERDRGGIYQNLGDFLTRVPLQGVNKTALTNLTHAGAFDGFGHSRRTLALNLPDLASGQRKLQRQADNGQDDIFSALLSTEELSVVNDFNVPDLPEYDKTTKLSLERESIGLYLSDHPLANINGALESLVGKTIAEIKVDPNIPVGFAGRDAEKTVVGGLIVSMEIKRTKTSGDQMAILQVEDRMSSIEVVVFPRTYAEYKDVLKMDSVFLLRGTVTRREEGAEVAMYLDSAQELELTYEGYIPFNLRLTADQVTEESVNSLKRVLDRHKGKNSPIVARVLDPVTKEVTTLDGIDGTFVNPSASMVSHVRALFGMNCIGKWKDR